MAPRVRAQRSAMDGRTHAPRTFRIHVARLLRLLMPHPSVDFAELDFATNRGARERLAGGGGGEGRLRRKVLRRHPPKQNPPTHDVIAHLSRNDHLMRIILLGSNKFTRPQ